MRVERGIVPDRLAEHADRSLARLELPGHELHERRLAGAVRAEQAGDAGRHRQRDVVQADHLAVPLRQVVGGDDRPAASRHDLDAAHAPLEDDARRRPEAPHGQQRHGHGVVTGAAAGRSRRPPESHRWAETATTTTFARDAFSTANSAWLKKINAVYRCRHTGCCSTARTAPASSPRPRSPRGTRTR